MFPADFGYVRARTLDEALDLLDEAHADDQEAKLIAGGQSLLPMMKLRLAAPQVLIDIAELPELRGGGWMGYAAGGSFSGSLGALTTYRQLGRHALLAGGVIRGRSANVAPRHAGGIPAVTDVLRVLADPQVRARGTIGGAVAHGDPASDLPAVLLALNAELTIAFRKGRRPESRLGPYGSRRSAGEPTDIGKREISLDDFLQGIYTTDLAEDEIITHVSIRHPGGTASAYEKFPHPASHLPLAGVAVVLTYRAGRLTGSGGNVTDLADAGLADARIADADADAGVAGARIDDAAIAVTGISPRPYRARAAEALLRGAFPAQETLAAAAAQVTAEARRDRISLLGDQHASADYRAHLAEVLTRRALVKAIARGDGGANGDRGTRGDQGDRSR